jgi:16S rRNA (cytosine967-C5)-methyltransferase
MTDLSAPASATAARRDAFHALGRIESDGAFAKFAGRKGGDARDARFATELVAGVTRMERLLDWWIDRLYAKDPERLQIGVRRILRMGLYELTHMDTPDHAALNEYVELTRQSVGDRATGLVNGVLRTATRWDRPPQPDHADTAERLAILHSHPSWLVRKWITKWGQVATERLLAHNNARPTFGIRPNRLHPEADRFAERLRASVVEAEPSRWVEGMWTAQSVQPLVRDGLLNDGLCSVQDEAAALVVHLLELQPGQTLFDVCAAPGGKTCYAAERSGNKARIVASDVSRNRTRLVARSAQRLGLTSIETIEASVADRAKSREQADALLVDAPCSGTGVLGKRADMRWHRTPAELDELRALQIDLLKDAARLVAPGGRLVYATCSLEAEENERQVSRFLKKHPDFALRSAAGLVPDDMVTPDGFYAATPQQHGTDGAFGAILVRSGA